MKFIENLGNTCWLAGEGGIVDSSGLANTSRALLLQRGLLSIFDNVTRKLNNLRYCYYYLFY